MGSRPWPPSDATLDRFRQIGDPAGDAMVAEIFQDAGHEGVRSMYLAIVEHDLDYDRLEGDGGTRKAMHPAVGRFLAEQRRAFQGIAPDTRLGQEMFADLGPEIFLILGCYSLPSAYATERGVRVLARTGYLELQTNRRLVETSQMVVNVMTAGGLDPGGVGVRTAEKVRLMHAAIRYLILHGAGGAWDSAALGVSINQEDMAGTLRTFSSLVLDGLDKLGFDPGDEQRQAYIDAWGHVGLIMGVDPDLVPAGPEEAAALMATIERRQVRPVQAGRELVRPLLTTLDHHIVPGLPAALMRRFLPPGVCDGLEIPRHRIARALLAAPVATTWLVTRVGRRFWRPTPLYRELSMRLLQALLDHDRGGSRPEFGLPDSLHWYRSDGASGAAQRVLVNTARRISKASD